MLATHCSGLRSLEKAETSMGSTSATVSGTSLSRAQQRVVPERGMPVSRISGGMGRRLANGFGGRRVQRVLFYRQYRRFQGGHLKVWDYFQHLRQHADYEPTVYFTPDSVWDETNPWHAAPEHVVGAFRPEAADLLFLAGMDWLALSPERRKAPGRPVINLIQHVRHADPAQPLHEFLEHPAVRLCVSAEVESAIVATGRVNGPVVTIPNGVDVSIRPGLPWQHRPIDVLVVGLKQAVMAAEVARMLPGDLRQVVMERRIERSRLLTLMAEAKVVVCLPDPTEGFYLPALEAMALGALVVCPDAVGNRGFCIDGRTCLMPARDAASLATAAASAARLSAAERDPLLAAASDKVQEHTLAAEAQRFSRLLADLPQLWRQSCEGGRPG